MSSERTNDEQLPMAVTQSSSRTRDGDLRVVSTGIEPTTDRLNQGIRSGERASWSNRIVYLLSIIGFVVDLGQ